MALVFISFATLLEFRKLPWPCQSNHLCTHASARNPSSSAAAPVQRWWVNSNIRCFPGCPGFFFSPSIHSIQQCTTHQVTLAFREERGKGRFQEISLIILWPRTTVCMDLTPTKIIISMVHTLKWSEIEIISATLLKITSVPNCDALLHQQFSTPLAACALARLGWSFKASTASWKASWWSQAVGPSWIRQDCLYAFATENRFQMHGFVGALHFWFWQ